MCLAVDYLGRKSATRDTAAAEWSYEVGVDCSECIGSGDDDLSGLPVLALDNDRNLVTLL